ncbi:MAG: hypothetical protein V4548_12980 [Bacteroidota bacterium]
MKLFNFLLVLILLHSCNSNEKKQIYFKRVYVERAEDNFDGKRNINYSHYILIKNYKDDFFGDDFISKTKNYIDTVKVNKDSIYEIYYIRSIKDCGFEINELDNPIINKNLIVGFTVLKNKINGLILPQGENNIFFKAKDSLIVGYNQ